MTTRPSADEVTAELRRIAEVAQPTDSQRELRARLEAAGVHLSEPQVKRRIMAMARALGLDPTPAAERAAARTRPTDRRAGAIARRWRRHCL